MAAGSVFSALAAQAHSEKVAAAVAEVLRGNSYAGDTQAIAAATALHVAIPAAKVFLCPDQNVFIDSPPPWIAVCPISEDSEKQTGAELLHRVTVRIYTAYNESRTTIGTTDKTVRAALRYVRAAIVASGTLRVTAFSNVALVRWLERIGPVIFGFLGADNAPIRVPDGAFPPMNVARVQEQDFTFQYLVEAFTGAASSP